MQNGTELWCVMSRKAIVVCVAVVLIAVFACIAYYEYSKREALRACEISLADVRVRSVGLTSASLEIVLRIYNPNTITATLDRVDYSVYANGVYLGYGSITNRVDIPPGSTAYVSSPFELSYSGALKTIWEYLISGGKLEWRIKGVAHIDTPLGALNIPFDITATR